ncbi:MAG: hypothetical protein A2499_06975 [Stygiobacter sp. RIFOXYC12_FULL_38_8]|nr:MAG: hypothetical protein FD122_1778 [Stygiobacter sp.]KAF0212206.1 MAG: hypothetical protein FD178_3180 [Ignavibacteria bacterium]OGU66105.1 MAG: hypothetical protein A2X62_02935 [Stygiobacter sp. GWC2_38_9]OGU81123.1 MAG: hypothetical protein A2279_08575 [Stygiobacter sp. RIFOXYA12_FULL_38_9]OGV08050.1 MAG: hypothetical protein A2299_16080 [Stygiobacter sp. RIFOXYB2_FULL_37_11]OGV13080.1 MAG: hypothetical protein A2237_05770 [Stygiobacter sp. RIFOXYA2_FULL_38_8]OGV15277.1 MAG: hypothetic
MQPARIKVKEKKYLQILWDDSSTSEIMLANLRRQCPCAVCAAEKETESSSYVPIYSEQQLTLKSVQSVGNYAIGVIWGDDHNTGIYDFSYLKQLSEQRARN